MRRSQDNNDKGVIVISLDPESLDTRVRPRERGHQQGDEVTAPHSTFHRVKKSVFKNFIGGTLSACRLGTSWAVAAVTAWHIIDAFEVCCVYCMQCSAILFTLLLLPSIIRLCVLGC